jgi:hypothetical protein
LRVGIGIGIGIGGLWKGGKGGWRELFLGVDHSSSSSGKME